jgi:cell division protein FtsN
MTKDYAKPSTTRKSSSSKKKSSARKPTKAAVKATPKPTSKGHGKYIVLMLIVVGLFVYGLYNLARIPPEQLSKQSELLTPPTQTPSKAPTKPAEPAKVQKQPEARFKFYDLLPNSEVESSTTDAYQFKEKGQSEQYLYMLQTGSFKSATDAERQKATIAFQGLKAKISTVKSDSGTTWHRVETGPYNSRSEMNAALDKLVAINIQPLVKKTKK